MANLFIEHFLLIDQLLNDDLPFPQLLVHNLLKIHVLVLQQLNLSFVSINLSIALSVSPITLFQVASAHLIHLMVNFFVLSLTHLVFLHPQAYFLNLALDFLLISHYLASHFSDQFDTLFALSKIVRPDAVYLVLQFNVFI